MIEADGVVSAYHQAKHSWVITMVDQSPGSSDYHLSQVFPELDKEAALKKVKEAKSWLMALPLFKRPLVKSGAQVMAEDAIRYTSRIHEFSILSLLHTTPRSCRCVSGRMRSTFLYYLLALPKQGLGGDHWPTCFHCTGLLSWCFCKAGPTVQKQKLMQATKVGHAAMGMSRLIRETLLAL